eukprot:4049124-Heterocapsa_arctica.AAC.1
MAEIRAFGDCVTVDHPVSKNDVCAGIDDERLGMVILDRARPGWRRTSWWPLRQIKVDQSLPVTLPA